MYHNYMERSVQISVTVFHTATPINYQLIPYNSMQHIITNTKYCMVNGKTCTMQMAG